MLETNLYWLIQFCLSSKKTINRGREAQAFSGTYTSIPLQVSPDRRFRPPQLFRYPFIRTSGLR